MTTPIDKTRGEGNCGRATDRGEEACECSIAVASGGILTKAARLRTETSYKAGSARRVSQRAPIAVRRIGRQSRSRNVVQVNGEHAQRKFTLLSREICKAACESPFAPASKACLKAWNVLVQTFAGNAEVSRGRSTETRNPIETGRTER